MCESVCVCARAGLLSVTTTPHATLSYRRDEGACVRVWSSAHGMLGLIANQVAMAM